MSPDRRSKARAWEVVKAEMIGWFEVRVDGPSRRDYRLFSLLDYHAVGVAKPLVVIDGCEKAFRMTCL